MAEIVWTEQAITDIDQICDFISQDSPYYSELFAEQTISNIEKLKIFPGSGRKVPELNDENIREII
ncbi:MAG: hypothetical protein B6241_14760 [Spirochaetaceae bacterium 4572_59]|nr:MAG: hypothetical protein B6241_14760 [Spirochaetaceae bacterium 4572_59]